MSTRKLLAAVAASLAASLAGAQAFPSKPMRIVAPFPAASVADVLARPIAQKLNESWGQPVVVENRVGVAGSVGAEVVAKAPPDGYTMLLGTIGTNAINAALYAKMPYDVRTDFAPITLVANSYLLLVMHPSVPVRTVKDVIALAKANPGKLNFGSAGAGTTPHLSGEMFKHLAGVSITHVPYKGSPQSAIDLLAGRLDLIFANGSAVLPHIRNGRMRLIAISASRRDPAMAEVPTIGETVKGFVMEPWWGLFAPAGTPRDIVAKLNAEAVRIVGLPDVRANYLNLGLFAVSSSPEQFGAFVQEEIVRWAKVVKASGAKAD